MKALEHLGLADYDDLFHRAVLLDGTPEYGADVWTWYEDDKVYRCVGVARGVYGLLAWDATHGWIFSIESPAENVWAPLFSKDDPRNRPDMARVAMVLVRSEWTGAGGVRTFSEAKLAAREQGR